MEQHVIDSNLIKTIEGLSGLLILRHVATNGYFFGQTNDLKRNLQTFTSLLNVGRFPNEYFQRAYDADDELRCMFVPLICSRKQRWLEQKELMDSYLQRGELVFNLLAIDGSKQTPSVFSSKLDKVLATVPKVEEPDYTQQSKQFVNNKKFKKAMRGVPAAYVIVHPSSGGSYIGSTKDMSDRIGDHQTSLERGKHRSKGLQAAYNRDPELRWMIVRVKDEEMARYHEQVLLDGYLAEGKLVFNTGTVTSSPNKGTMFSDETRAKMSVTRTGKPPSPKWVENVTKSSREFRGRPVWINNVRYQSVPDAQETLNVTRSMIYGRCKSPFWPTWCFEDSLDKEDKRLGI